MLKIETRTIVKSDGQVLQVQLPPATPEGENLYAMERLTPALDKTVIDQHLVKLKHPPKESWDQSRLRANSGKLLTLSTTEEPAVLSPFDSLTLAA